MFRSQHPRGLSLPSLWQWLVLVSVICAAWVVWSETRHRRLIPGVALLPDDTTERLQSIEALVRDGDVSVPLLLNMLADPDPKIRRDSLMGLGRLDSPTDEVQVAVRARLSDDDARVRLYAVSAYKQMCGDERELGELAVRLLADPDGSVREKSSETLELGGPEMIPIVFSALSNESAFVRSQCIDVLKRLKLRNQRPLADAIPAIRALMNDSDTAVRRQAIEAVVDWGSARPEEARAWRRDNDIEVAWLGLRATDWGRPECADAVPNLIRMIQKDAGTRFRSLVWMLRSTKSAGNAAVPLLLQLLNSPAAMERLKKTWSGGRMEVELFEMLEEIGADADDLSRLVAPHLADVSGGNWAREILVRTSPEKARRQVTLLIPQLESSQAPVVESALGLLRGYRTQAREAVPVLTRLIRHPDEKIAERAIALLADIAPEDSAPAVPVILALLERERDDSSGPFHPLIESLGKIGPAAKEAVPALRRKLQSSPPKPSDVDWGLDWLRLKSILALGRIGCDDPDVIDLLKLLLNGDSWKDRAAAAEALASPGVSTEFVLTDLIEALHDEHSYVRGIAALAIGELMGDRAAAVEPLVAALKDDDAYVQSAAAIALGQIGNAAAQAIDALRDASREPMHAVSNHKRSQTYTWGLRNDRFHDRRSVEQAARWALSQIEVATATKSGE